MAPTWNNYFDHYLEVKTLVTSSDEKPKSARPKATAKKAKAKQK